VPNTLCPQESHLQRAEIRAALQKLFFTESLQKKQRQHDKNAAVGNGVTGKKEGGKELMLLESICIANQEKVSLEMIRNLDCRL